MEKAFLHNNLGVIALRDCQYLEAHQHFTLAENYATDEYILPKINKLLVHLIFYLVEVYSKNSFNLKVYLFNTENRMNIVDNLPSEIKNQISIQYDKDFTHKDIIDSLSNLNKIEKLDKLERIENWELDKMEEMALSILNYNFNITKLWKILGMIHLIQKKWDHCLRDCKLAIKLDPQDLEIQFLVSICYWSSGKEYEAILLSQNYLEHLESKILYKDESYNGKDPHLDILNMHWIYIKILISDMYIFSKYPSKKKMKKGIIILEECFAKILNITSLNSKKKSIFSHRLNYCLEHYLKSISFVLSRNNLSQEILNLSNISKELEYNIIYHKYLTNLNLGLNQLFSFNDTIQNLNIIEKNIYNDLNVKSKLFDRLSLKLISTKIGVLSFHYNSLHGISNFQFNNLLEINNINKNYLGVKSELGQSLYSLISHSSIPIDDLVQLWRGCLQNASPVTGYIILSNSLESHWRLFSLLEIGYNYPLQDFNLNITLIPSLDSSKLFMSIYILNRSYFLTKFQKEFLYQAIQFLLLESDDSFIFYEYCLYIYKFNEINLNQEILTDYRWELEQYKTFEFQFLYCKLLYKRKNNISLRKALSKLRSISESFSVQILRLKIFKQLGLIEEFESEMKKCNPITLEQLMNLNRIAFKFYKTQLLINESEKYYIKWEKNIQQFEQWILYNNTTEASIFLKKIKMQLNLSKLSKYYTYNNSELSTQLNIFNTNWLSNSKLIQDQSNTNLSSDILIYNGLLYNSIRFRILKYSLGTVKNPISFFKLLYNYSDILLDDSTLNSNISNIWVHILLSKIKFEDFDISNVSLTTSVRFPRPDLIFSLSIFLFENNKFQDLRNLIKKFSFEETYKNEKNQYYLAFKFIDFVSKISNNDQKSDDYHKLQQNSLKFLKLELLPRIEELFLIFTNKSLENSFRILIHFYDINSMPNNSLRVLISIFEKNLEVFHSLYIEILNLKLNLVNRIEINILNSVIIKSINHLNTKFISKKENDTFSYNHKLSKNIQLLLRNLINLKFNLDFLSFFKSFGLLNQSLEIKNELFNNSILQQLISNKNCTRLSLNVLQYDYFISIENKQSIYLPYLNFQKNLLIFSMQESLKANDEVNDYKREANFINIQTFFSLLKMENILNNDLNFKSLLEIKNRISNISDYFEQQLYINSIYISCNLEELSNDWVLNIEENISFSNTKQLTNWLLDSLTLKHDFKILYPKKEILNHSQIASSLNLPLSGWRYELNNFFNSWSKLLLTISKLTIYYSKSTIYTFLIQLINTFEYFSELKGDSKSEFNKVRSDSISIIKEIITTIFYDIFINNLASFQDIIHNYESIESFSNYIFEFINQFTNICSEKEIDIQDGVEFCVHFIILFNNNYKNNINNNNEYSNFNLQIPKLFSKNGNIISFRLWSALLCKLGKNLLFDQKLMLSVGVFMSICYIIKHIQGDFDFNLKFNNIFDIDQHSFLVKDPLLIFWNLFSHEIPYSYLTHPFGCTLEWNGNTNSFHPMKGFILSINTTLPYLMFTILKLINQIEQDKLLNIYNYENNIKYYYNYLNCLLISLNTLFEEMVLYWNDLKTYSFIISKILLFLINNESFIKTLNFLFITEKYDLQLWIDIAWNFDENSLKKFISKFNIQKILSVGLIELHSFFHGNISRENFLKINYGKSFTKIISSMFSKLLEAKVSLEFQLDGRLKLNCLKFNSKTSKYIEYIYLTNGTDKAMDTHNLLCFEAIHYFIGKFLDAPIFIRFGSELLTLNPPGVNLQSAISISQSLRDSNVKSNSILPWIEHSLSLKGISRIQEISTNILSNEYYNILYSFVKDISIWNVTSLFLGTKLNEQNGVFCLEDGHIYLNSPLCFINDTNIESSINKGAYQNSFGLVQKLTLDNYKHGVINTIEYIKCRFDGFINLLDVLSEDDSILGYYKFSEISKKFIDFKENNIKLIEKFNNEEKKFKDDQLLQQLKSHYLFLKQSHSNNSIESLNIDLKSSLNSDEIYNNSRNYNQTKKFNKSILDSFEFDKLNSPQSFKLNQENIKQIQLFLKNKGNLYGNQTSEDIYTNNFIKD